MKHLLTEEATFDYLKARWENLSEERFRQIDGELVEALAWINQHPSLVSVMSCASHLDDPNKRTFYVHFAVRDEAGMAVLADLYTSVSGTVLDEYLVGQSLSRIIQPDELKPRHVRLTHLLMGVPHLPGETPPEPYYQATTVAVSFNAHNHSKWHKPILRMFRQAVEKAVTGELGSLT